MNFVTTEQVNEMINAALAEQSKRYNVHIFGLRERIKYLDGLIKDLDIQVKDHNVAIDKIEEDINDLNDEVNYFSERILDMQTII